MAAKKAGKKSNPYSRAQMRSRFRNPRQRRSGALMWGGIIGVVVILGVVLVAIVREDHQAAANTAPFPPSADNPSGDHWHSYLGINICGTWQPNWPSFETVDGSPNVSTGIHSHGDGLIHIHPFTRSEGGSNATVGRFIENGGGKVSSSSIELADGTTMSSGDVCESGDYEGQEVVLRWTVDGEEQDGNPGGYQLANGEVIAIYLLPEDAPLDPPPGAEASLGAPSDLAPPGGQTPLPEGLEGVEGLEGLQGLEVETPAGEVPTTEAPVGGGTDAETGTDGSGAQAPPP